MIAYKKGNLDWLHKKVDFTVFSLPYFIVPKGRVF